MKNKIPNEETLKTMDETEKAIGLIDSENLEDFFNKIGLSDSK